MSKRTNEDYQPHKKQKEILEVAWRMVRAVPYEVTSRWLFYQLLQAGFYQSKDDYKNKFIPLFSCARRSFYGPWTPNSLVDDRREAIEHEGYYENVDEWVKSFSSGGFSCNLDHFYEQENYVEIWFEAEAMSRQFQHYTRGITLRPFSGMPSIAYKWSIAKALEEAAERYDKPIYVLYFGDYDTAGMTIPETSIEDIEEWCAEPFDVIRGGLNQGDEVKYHIPENIERPGAYQWEALGDETARALITSSVREYLDLSLIEESEREGKAAASAFDKFVSGFSDYYAKNNHGGNSEEAEE